MFVVTKREWNQILNDEFKEFSDIYFRYEYFKLYSKHYGVEPEGIYWEDKNIKVFWTHLIRDISEIEQFRSFKYYDLTTPYGYGGPIVYPKTENYTKVSKSLLLFLEEYKKYALKNNYVSEFIRFHPIFKNWEFFKGILDIKYINDVVIVDLTQDINEIWAKIKKGHKYNIKKCIKVGCTAEIINKPSDKDIENFIKLYYHTMNKNHASEKYYFSPQFIEYHFELLNAILVNIEYNGEIIGSSIFIFDKEIITYHLSGTYGLKGIYPSNMVIWEAIVWAKNNGFRFLNLGGGRGKNDSLFKFKAGFSNIYFKQYMGRIIFNKEIYNELVKKAGTPSDLDYFPLYRSKFDKTIV